MRELGKYPIFGELVFKRNNDQNFPNPSAFTQRYSKNDWLKKLIEYCGNDENLSDVLKICQSIHTPKQEVAEEIATSDEKFGFVYLIKSGKHYKIGKTNHIGRRSYEIGLQLPEKEKIIHEIRNDDPSGIEEYWHKRFADRRKNGEWFELSASDVKAFKQWRKII